VPPLLADPALAREYQRSYSGATVLVRDSSVLVRAVFVDIQAAFARYAGTEFTIDGAHLNNAGARLAAEVVAEHLRVASS
jgi:lysophospholipase L1-like esterase